MTRSARTRRFAPRLAVFLLATVLLAACGSDDTGGAIDEPDQPGDTTARPAVETVQEGTLTACSDIPYAPFEYEENGEVVGIDPDLVRGVAEELGMEAAFRDTDFDGIFAALTAGQCDLIASSVSITPERQEQHDFSQGYYEIRQSLLVRAGDASRYRDLDSLKGRTVGVQSETTGAAFAEERGKPAGVTIKEFTGADELFTALQAEQVDAVLQDLPINAYHAKTTGKTTVATVFDEGEPEQYGFVMKKGSPLVQAVDEALTALKADGRYEQILAKYLGTAAGTGGGAGGSGGAGGTGSSTTASTASRSSTTAP